MKLYLFFLYFLSTSLWAQQFGPEINFKNMKGTVHLYRDGVHFDYKGVKRLKPGDILQTMSSSTITIEYENCYMTLAPNTFFELKAGKSRKNIFTGKLYYGSIYSQLSIVRTEKPYRLEGAKFSADFLGSEIIYSMARNPRELKLMDKGTPFKAPAVLTDVLKFQNSANLFSRAIVIKGKTKMSLVNNDEYSLKELDSLEFKAEGIAVKKKALSKEEIQATLKGLAFNLPSL